MKFLNKKHLTFLACFGAGFVFAILLNLAWSLWDKTSNLSSRNHNHFVIQFSQLLVKALNDPTPHILEKLESILAKNFKARFNWQQIHQQLSTDSLELFKISGTNPYSLVLIDKNGPKLQFSFNVRNTEEGIIEIENLIVQKLKEGALEIQAVFNSQQVLLLQPPCTLFKNSILGFDGKITEHAFFDNTLELTSPTTESGTIKFECFKTKFVIPWRKASENTASDLMVKVPLKWGVEAKTISPLNIKDMPTKKLESELGLELEVRR